MIPIYQKDERDGYIFDARIKRGDTTFWSEHSGSLSTDTDDSTTAIRITSARVHSYLQHIYGDYEFSASIPVVPGSGIDHSWGLRNPTNDTTLGDSNIVAGGIYFQVDSDVVTAISYDDFGNKETTTITWNALWTAKQTRYKIRWEEDIVNFLVNDSVVATHTKVPKHPQSLEIRNGDASNLDVAFVRVARAGAII